MAADEIDKRKSVRVVSPDGKTSALRALGPKPTLIPTQPQLAHPVGRRDGYEPVGKEVKSRETLGKTKGSSSARCGIDPGFIAIDKAWWQWVDENCPSKSKRARGKWMRENTFSYDGTTWERFSVPHKSNSGKTVVANSTVYRSADERTLGNGQWAPNRRNDPKRNWGLPE